MDTADRNYVEALIEQALTATKNAREVAESFGLVLTSERLAFALSFQKAAIRALSESDRNPDGTTGPEHVTDRGIELDPPKG